MEIAKAYDGRLEEMNASLCATKRQISGASKRELPVPKRDHVDHTPPHKQLERNIFTPQVAVESDGPSVELGLVESFDVWLRKRNMHASRDIFPPLPTSPCPSAPIDGKNSRVRMPNVAMRKPLGSLYDPNRKTTEGTRPILKRISTAMRYSSATVGQANNVDKENHDVEAAVDSKAEKSATNRSGNDSTKVDRKPDLDQWSDWTSRTPSQATQSSVSAAPITLQSIWSITPLELSSLLLRARHSITCARRTNGEQLLFFGKAYRMRE